MEVRSTRTFCLTAAFSMAVDSTSASVCETYIAFWVSVGLDGNLLTLSINVINIKEIIFSSVSRTSKLENTFDSTLIYVLQSLGGKFACFRSLEENRLDLSYFF